MKTQNRIIAATAICFLFVVFATASNANANWLEKSLDFLRGSKSTSSVSDVLSNEEIGAGLREALRVGAETVVQQLGKVDGFNKDPDVHIPLPKKLKDVQKALDKFGLSSMLDDLELRLNRAAETATPQAKQLFLQAIEDMSIDDIQGIYNGPDDAATRYFEGKMSQSLSEAMTPIVNNSLADVGAIKSYDRIMEKYESIPFVPDVKSDLGAYVVDKGIDGIFHYLAKEEAAIRREPVKRTTELLRRVFGGK